MGGIGAREIGAVNVMLGGGRLDKTTVIDPKAGVLLRFLSLYLFLSLSLSLYLYVYIYMCVFNF